MKYYELIINTKETKETDSLLERVVSYLPGPVVHQQKNLSFLSLEFYSEPGKIEDLKKKLKANSLRYLILAKEPAKKTAGTQEKLRRIVAKPKPKVELKEIEKKLKEILNES